MSLNSHCQRRRDSPPPSPVWKVMKKTCDWPCQGQPDTYMINYNWSEVVGYMTDSVWIRYLPFGLLCLWGAWSWKENCIFFKPNVCKGERNIYQEKEVLPQRTKGGVLGRQNNPIHDNNFYWFKGEVIILEKTLESPLDCKEIEPVNSTWKFRKSTLNILWKDWCWLELKL